MQQVICHFMYARKQMCGSRNGWSISENLNEIIQLPQDVSKMKETPVLHL
jgi:hypothetical protein